MTETLLAAGGLIWRWVDTGLEVALVHRARYDDWSLPKGKLDRTETLLQAAVREVGEETGQRVTVGPRLPTTSYDVGARPERTGKQVHWWLMQARGGTFVANDEVDELAWLSPAAAIERVGYANDADLLATLLTPGPRAAPPARPRVLLVRHASAGDRARWAGPDDARPLDERGRAEAEALAVMLPLFAPTAIHSAPPLRCLETVAPLVAATGLPVVDAPEVGEEGYWHHPLRGFTTLRDLLAAAAPTVVCSQGGAIPDLLDRLFALHRPLVTGVSPTRTDPDPPCRKGSAWVLSADEGGALVQADYYGQPGE